MNKDLDTTPIAEHYTRHEVTALNRRVSLDLTPDDHSDLNWQVDALINRTSHSFGDNYGTW